ncbi:MAG: TPM domain-containing protein [Myxococcales bacterium]
MILAVGAVLPVLVMAAVLGASSPAVLAMPATTTAGEQHLWDHSHLLSTSDRLQLDQRLNGAERRLGSPLYLVIVAKLRNETAAQMAERTLRALVEVDARHHNGIGLNPLLLLVSIEDRAAAIATGKGNAGLVPEVDAAIITSRLMAGRPRSSDGGIDHRWTAAIAGAIDAIVTSAEATAARRRPLPADDDDTAGSSTTDVTSPPPADVENSHPPSHSGSHIRMGIATALAAVVLMGLALRRRRNLVAARPMIPPPPAGKPHLPSVIDRPPPHQRTPRDPTGRRR